MRRVGKALVDMEKHVEKNIQANDALDTLIRGYVGIEHRVKYGRPGDHVASILLLIGTIYFGGWHGVGLSVIALAVGTVVNIRTFPTR